MRALVTGGAGFIGSHLTETLIDSGHGVTVIDDLSTGRIENLAHVAQSPALRTHWASIVEEERLQELVDEADVVYHLAAAVGVRLILDGDPSGAREHLTWVVTHGNRAFREFALATQALGRM